VKSGEVTIHIGGVYASERPTIIKTLLGSCVAVCLHDPERAVGGMNHFMLPRGDGDDAEAGRFGVHAMDLLIGAIMKAGGDRRRLVAKVFGGAHVLEISGSVVDVPRRNIDFKHVRRVRPHALAEAQARAAPPISYGSITLFD